MSFFELDRLPIAQSLLLEIFNPDPAHSDSDVCPDYELDPMWSSSRFSEWLLATYKDDVWRKRLRPALRRLVVDTLTSTQVERLAINGDSQGGLRARTERAGGVRRASLDQAML